MCKQQKLWVLHLSFYEWWIINTFVLRGECLPTDIVCFFIYLTPAESKNQAAQENEHKAWEKRKGVFVNIIGEKEVYIFMFSTHHYTHSMLNYIYANLLVTLRKVGNQSKRQLCMEKSWIQGLAIKNSD